MVAHNLDVPHNDTSNHMHVLYVYIYIFIYLFICLFLHVYMYIYIYIYVCVYASKNKCILLAREAP